MCSWNKEWDVGDSLEEDIYQPCMSLWAIPHTTLHGAHKHLHPVLVVCQASLPQQPDDLAAQNVQDVLARLHWEVFLDEPPQDRDVCLEPHNGPLDEGVHTGHKVGITAFVFLIAPQQEPANTLETLHNVSIHRK